MEHIGQEGSLTVTEMAAKLGVSSDNPKGYKTPGCNGFGERTHGGALRKSLAPMCSAFGADSSVTSKKDPDWKILCLFGDGWAVDHPRFWNDNFQNC